jgi:PAS domain S-box-containing protein
LALLEQGKLRFPVTDRRLFEIQISYLVEDSDGSLWLATASSGARKIARHGFTTYGAEDGLGHGIGNFIESPTGEFYITTEAWRISRYDGQSFTTVQPKLPPSIREAGWRPTKNVLQDHTGQWWLAMQTGLCRFPAVRRQEDLAVTPPIAIYTKRDGLADENLTRLYEDVRGDLWIASFAPSEEVITRWERASGRFYRYSARDGLRPFNAVMAFAEDQKGQLWLAFREGGLARYRDGQFRYFAAADGIPSGAIESLYCDPAGRLWFTVAQAGLFRLDDPQAEPLRFRVYTRKQGLSGNLFTRITGDREGRIYVGTASGIDQIGPATDVIKQYTTGDGLVNVELTSTHRDRNGRLWFGTTNGLMSFVPQADRTPPPPPVLNTGLRVAGVEQLISALGTTALTLPALGSHQNQLSVEYAGIGFAPGETLRFEYRLEGADREWSAPADLRAINFSNLAPGTYRFAVRAINASGVRSAAPATVSFRILPPFWRRWWFIALSGLSLVAFTSAFVRTRLARVRTLRESETRFRTLAETASDAIITVDPRGRIVFVNSTTEKIFGYSTAEMAGQDLTMLMPEYLRHLHSAGFERYQQTGRRHISWNSVELPGLHRDGHEIPLELSFGEFTSEGKRYFTGIARDITERKQAAEALQQSREERLAELERVRRRIATDLHDDIGSSLTQISILSEVLRQRLNPATGTLARDGQQHINEPLQLIAGASRELVDSMSDIVWAINPQKDHLRDLMQRMRRFAADSFTARNIRFRLRLPDENEDLTMGANLRREVFLIFKEGVNNMVKHSGCTEADIELAISDGELSLRLADNGRGFDLARESDGHGLVSMLDRAKGIGGRFQVTSQPGVGTTISLHVDLDSSSMTGRSRHLTT